MKKRKRQRTYIFLVFISKLFLFFISNLTTLPFFLIGRYPGQLPCAGWGFLNSRRWQDASLSTAKSQAAPASLL